MPDPPSGQIFKNFEPQSGREWDIWIDLQIRGSDHEYALRASDPYNTTI
jgi:hypothetical protein